MPPSPPPLSLPLSLQVEEYYSDTSDGKLYDLLFNVTMFFLIVSMTRQQSVSSGSSSIPVVGPPLIGAIKNKVILNVVSSSSIIKTRLVGLVKDAPRNMRGCP